MLREMLSISFIESRFLQEMVHSEGVTAESCERPAY